MSSKLTVVVGGQFGSEGKGAVAGMLAGEVRVSTNLLCVRVAGPNAGHSVVAPNGQKWALRQIPVGALVNPTAKLAIAAGSEIDIEVLMQEVEELDGAGYGVSQRLMIDRNATVISHEDKLAETDQVVRIGSTGKGIGAARSRRIWREAETWGIRPAPWDANRITGDDVAVQTRMVAHQGGQVHIEGTQGYGLGLHTNYYPQCTSSDCRWYDFVGMLGVSPTDFDTLAVWVVLRTYPIRVAGNSGPLQAETTWDTLSKHTGGYIQEERTTVTKKVRRVGLWDNQLAREALAANGRTSQVALTFFDYWFPELEGATEEKDLTPDARDRIRRVQYRMDHRIDWIGTGPATGIWLP